LLFMMAFFRDSFDFNFDFNKDSVQ
jgi:hypothetical protein